MGLKENLKSFNVEKILKNVQYLGVESGNFAIVDSGTIHSIMVNNLVCEIQVNSDEALRIYDWGRERDLSFKETIR